jgi:ABC-type nitrate/sulfonate/bicarbonate transport system permease component
MEEVTVVAGVPIPSASPWFLGGVAVHVAMGLVCVVAGIGAMLARKGRGRHSRCGTVYFWFLLGVFVTATGLSIVR